MQNVKLDLQINNLKNATDQGVQNSQNNGNGNLNDLQKLNTLQNQPQKKVQNAFLQLDVKNFRSYRSLSLQFSSNLVIFTGQNGAGKTNILEAISLFSSGNGIRKSQYQDMLTQDIYGKWMINSVINVKNCSFFLATEQNENKRTGQIDNVKINSFKNFDKLIWMLWLTPKMLNIFLQPNSDVRKFFDHLVSSFNPTHRTKINNLNTLLKERIKVLTNHYNTTWLDVLEQQIIDECIYIHILRQKFIYLIGQNHARQPKINISLDGKMESILENQLEESARMELLGIMRKNREIDTIKQTTSIGAHRTNIKITQQNRPISECSTGEQNILLILLIIACIKINQQFNNTVPILLLDDVMAHLDYKHRNDLLQNLIHLGVQTFFTGTEKIFFEYIKNDGQFFCVHNSICSCQ